MGWSVPSRKRVTRRSHQGMEHVDLLFYTGDPIDIQNFAASNE